MVISSSCGISLKRGPASLNIKKSCKSTLNKISSRFAENMIKNNYKQIALETIINKKNNNFYYIISKENSLYGKIEEIELFDEYFLLKISDEYGTHHYIDPRMEKIDIFEGKKIHKKNNFNVKKSTKLPILDEDRFLKGYCSNLKKVKSSKDYKTFNKVFNKFAIKSKLVNNRSKAFGLCLMSLGASSALFMDIDMGIEDSENYFAEIFNAHGTNYVLGLGMMAITHQCTSILSPKHYDLFFKLAVGGNIAANLMYEIKLSDTFIPPVENDPVRTDIPDFTSGMMSVFSYQILSKMFKLIYNTSDTKFCQKY